MNSQYFGDNPNMFIVRAPLRISLFGGGTDLPHFYEKYGATVISFALDKYIYLIFNHRFTGGWRVSYSVTEEVTNYDDIWHTLVKAAYLKYHPDPCTLTIIGDMPKETGLGSSSALAVALVRAFEPGAQADELAESAFRLERGTGAPVGKQDHYAAAFGDFRSYSFGPGSERTRIISHSRALLRELREWGLLLYTGRSRPAAPLLAELEQHGDEGALLEIKYIADDVAMIMAAKPETVDAERVGYWLHCTWQAKRQVAAGITDAALDAQYEAALAAGAVGGKLLGAGGGGCWFLIVPPSAQQRVKDALGLLEIPWSWDVNGCKAVLGHGAWLRSGESASQRIGESASRRVNELTELPL